MPVWKASIKLKNFSKTMLHMVETLTQVGFSDYYTYMLHYKNRSWIYSQYKKAADKVIERGIFRHTPMAEGIIGRKN